VLPLFAGLICGWLLPELAGAGYVSLVHVAFAGLALRPFLGGPWAAMAALAAYCAAGALMLWLASWQLRRWPPTG